MVKLSKSALALIVISFLAIVLWPTFQARTALPEAKRVIKGISDHNYSDVYSIELFDRTSKSNDSRKTIVRDAHKIGLFYKELQRLTIDSVEKGRPTTYDFILIEFKDKSKLKIQSWLVSKKIDDEVVSLNLRAPDGKFKKMARKYMGP